MIAYSLATPAVYSSAAAAPAANAVPSGAVIDIPTFGGEWISDGTYWRPRRGTATIFVSNTSSAVTGTTGETELATYAWPAGFASPNGQWKAEFLFHHTSSANNKTLKVKFGATSFYVATATTTASTQGVCIMRNANSLTTQTGHVSSQSSGYGSTAGTPPSGAVSTNSAFDIKVLGTLALDSETITLKGWTLKFEATA